MPRHDDTPIEDNVHSLRATLLRGLLFRSTCHVSICTFFLFCVFLLSLSFCLRLQVSQTDYCSEGAILEDFFLRSHIENWLRI